MSQPPGAEARVLAVQMMLCFGPGCGVLRCMCSSGITRIISSLSCICCALLRATNRLPNALKPHACTLRMQGDLNPWVLEQARCAELADAFDEFEPTFRDANEEVRSANSDIGGALFGPDPLVHYACLQTR